MLPYIEPCERAPVAPREPDLAQLMIMLAHDLRNPLTAVTTNLHFVRDALSSSLDADASEALTDSLLLCRMLERFIKNLDLVARNPPVSSRRTPCSLVRLAEEQVQKYADVACYAGVEVAIEPHDAELGDVLVDREPFSRAIENLLADAIDLAPRGSRVAIRLGRRDDELFLTVRHPPRERRRAVASSSVSSSKDPSLVAIRTCGRGLGIYCAGLAARMAGGRLTVDPAVDGASTQAHLFAPACS